MDLKAIIFLLIIIGAILYFKGTDVQQQSVISVGRQVGGGLADFVKKMFSQATESSDTFGRPKCLSAEMCNQFGEGVKCNLTTGECYAN